jgi:hypothetical protein
VLIERVPVAGPALGETPPLAWRLTLKGEAARAQHHESAERSAVLCIHDDESEQASTPPDATGPAKGKQRMTAEEANRKGMELARQLGKAFFVLSEREQAARIGCTWRTWSKTSIYKKARQQRRKQHPARGAPHAVSFSSAMEAVTGEGGREETLNKLVAEQEADYEPSPVEEDPPGDRPRKVYRPNQRL